MDCRRSNLSIVPAWAQAVAASACFPPLFGPLRIDRAAERFKGGRAPGVNADARRQILNDLRVTDGGVYDNMGLEPVWKSHRVVLVSDAGGLMDAEADKNFFWRIQRYQSIQDTQARALRKRFLISGYTQGTINGGSRHRHCEEGIGWRPTKQSLHRSGMRRPTIRPREIPAGVRDGRDQKHPHRPRRLG